MLLYLTTLHATPHAFASLAASLADDAELPAAEEPTQRTVDAIYALARATTGDEGGASADAAVDVSPLLSPQVRTPSRRPLA
jgi:hypothetical protein